MEIKKQFSINFALIFLIYIQLMFGNMFRMLPPVSKNLILINVIIWVFTWLVGNRAGMTIETYCGLHYFSSPLFYPWQIITYMFIHANFSHLFFNMFALFMFGGLLERTLGSPRFLFYYISCGIGAALIQEGVYAIMLDKYAHLLDPITLAEIEEKGAGIIRQGMNYVNPTLANYNLLLNNATVGASGAIYGILLAFAMYFPNMPLYLFFIPVPIKAKWMVLGYAAIELLLGLSNRAGDNVAHFAHLGGMLVGIIMILWWRKRARNNWQY